MIKTDNDGANAPIFIVGVPRSGTTLLRLILTTHPDICIPPESTFFADLESKYGKFKDLSAQINNFLNELYQNPKFQEWQIERSQLQENLTLHKPLKYGDAVETIYRTYLIMQKPEAKIWGDKNPIYIYQTNLIKKYFSNAKIIHIIRDVRSISCSFQKLQEFQEWNLASPTLVVRNFWNQASFIYKKYKNNFQFYHVYYEDLILFPEQTIKKICAWLKLPYSPKMLNFYLENSKKKKF